jgi:hypothetical protein
MARLVPFTVPAHPLALALALVVGLGLVLTLGAGACRDPNPTFFFDAAASDANRDAASADGAARDTGSTGSPVDGGGQ